MHLGKLTRSKDYSRGVKESQTCEPGAEAGALGGWQVEEMSPGAQDVIKRYCQEAGSGKYAPLCAVGGTLPWSNPRLVDFELLARVRLAPLSPWLCILQLRPCILPCMHVRS